MSFFKKLFQRKKNKEIEKNKQLYELKQEIKTTNDSICNSFLNTLDEDDFENRTLLITQTIINNTIIEHTRLDQLNEVVHYIQHDLNMYYRQNVFTETNKIQ